MSSGSIRQDNIAEKQQILLFGFVDGDLVFGNKKREGYDAFGPTGIPIECKTTSKGTDNYSTSARLGPNYIDKMSIADWVCSQALSGPKGIFAGFQKHTVILRERMVELWDRWRAHFTLVEEENRFVESVLCHPTVIEIFKDEIVSLNLKNQALIDAGIRKKKFKAPLVKIISDRLEHGKTINDPKLTNADVIKYGKVVTSVDEMNKILTTRSYDV